MSFTPYEHILGHNSPMYVGESARRNDRQDAFTGSMGELNKNVLGKRKISGPFVPQPPLKGLEHATRQSTPPSGSLRRNAGLSNSTVLSCVTPTKPKALARDPRDSATHRTATADNKGPERSQDPRRRRSHIECATSHFVGQHSPPSAPGKSLSSPVRFIAEPRTHNGPNLKTCEGDKGLTMVKIDGLAETGSRASASSQSQSLTLDFKVDNDITGCVRLTGSASSSNRSDISRLLGHHLVNISVGATRKVYRVHRKLLCHHSEYFRLRFQDPQRSTAPEEFVLPDTEETTFNLLVNWLYRGSFNHDPVGINRLYLLYYLAEKLGIPRLENMVMDLIRERYRTHPKVVLSYPGIERIHQVYGQTTANSPLRRFVVQAAWWTIVRDGASVKKYIDGSDVNGEFVRDFLKAMQKKVGANDVDPRSCVPCTFHTHEDGSKCITSTATNP